jgi:hypothetical protein
VWGRRDGTDGPMQLCAGGFRKLDRTDDGSVISVCDGRCRTVVSSVAEVMDHSDWSVVFCAGMQTVAGRLLLLSRERFYEVQINEVNPLSFSTAVQPRAY